MTDGTAGGNLSLPESVVSRRIATARLILGLLQGTALYGLYNAFEHKAWPATEGLLYAPLLVVALFVPVLLVTALGHMHLKRLMLWVAIATAIVAALGYYDIWRTSPDDIGRFGYDAERHGKLPSLFVSFFTAAGLYIAHSLILAGSGDRRWIARYPSYFETAWKFIVQLKFAALFVGVLWLVLWLGASLFMLLKLHFLQELLEKPWFSVPVTAFGFAAALHLTDVPIVLIGIYSLGLRVGDYGWTKGNGRMSALNPCAGCGRNHSATTCTAAPQNFSSGRR